MKSASESVQTALHSFFEGAAADLEMTMEKLSESMVSVPQSRGQLSRAVTKSLNYITSILLPTLTSLFHHLANQNYGPEVLGKSCMVFSSMEEFAIIHRVPNEGYSLKTTKEFDEQLLSTPLKSFGDLSTSLKSVLIKTFSYGYRAAGAYSPSC